MKRDKQISLRVKSNVLDIADELKNKTGYTRADIFELGVYLLDDGKTIDAVLEERILHEMLQSHKTLLKQIEDLGNTLSLQIHSLELRKKKVQSELDVKYDERSVNEAVEKIISIYNRRIERLLIPRATLEPMGEEFFERICKEYAVPLDSVLTELEGRGYTSEKFQSAGISVKNRWKGYVIASKESLV